MLEELLLETSGGTALDFLLLRSRDFSWVGAWALEGLVIDIASWKLSLLVFLLMLFLSIIINFFYFFSLDHGLLQVTLIECEVILRQVDAWKLIVFHFLILNK